MEALLRRIEYIDPQAAAYIRGRIANNDRNVHMSGSLCSAFSWASTPQGYEYWQEMERQLHKVQAVTSLGNVY